MPKTTNANEGESLEGSTLEESEDMTLIDSFRRATADMLHDVADVLFCAQDLKDARSEVREALENSESSEHASPGSVRKSIAEVIHTLGDVAMCAEEAKNTPES